jgi:hypothetical protein
VRFSSRSFGLAVLLLLLNFLPLSALSAQSDIQTIAVGDTIEDVRRRGEFLLNAEPGQSVTLHWEGPRGSNQCEAPLREILVIETTVTNADGDELAQTGLLYLPSGVVQVYELEGAPPYTISASICSSSNTTLQVIDGDAIARVEQPALNMRDEAEITYTPAAAEQLLVFPLNVQVGDVFSVDPRFLNRNRLDNFPIAGVIVRDADGHLVPSDFSERLPVGLSQRIYTYTVTGPVPYRIELPALPMHIDGYKSRFAAYIDGVSYSVRVDSGNTAIVDGGVLTPGDSVSDTLTIGIPAMYTFDVAEGEVFTLRRTFGLGTPYSNFLNAEDYNADVVESFVNTGSTINWVMHFEGPPPYVYYMEGEGSYTIALEAQDSVPRNEVAILTPGSVLSITVPPTDERIDYLTLDVNPESTIAFSWGITQTEFPIRDSEDMTVYPSNNQWNDGYAIVDMSQGTPPYVVSLDDARYAGQTITFTLTEGETPLPPDGAASTNTSEGSETSRESQSETGCTVSASSTINQRSGPGTNFDVSGSLTGGSSVAVEGQTTGADGSTWYRLTTGAWVRSDLVTASAACADVPEAAP